MQRTLIRRSLPTLSMASLCLSGCGAVPTRAVESAITVPTGRVELASRRDSNTLVVELHPAGAGRPVPTPSEKGTESAPGKRRSSGMVRIVIEHDSTFEYQLTVYNDDRRTYRSARVYDGDPADGGKLVATLFSDLSLGGRYIQIRGTATLPSTIKAQDLASQLRQRPSDFIFRVEQRVPAAGALTGSVPTLR
jgi:hypothetical protein